MPGLRPTRARAWFAWTGATSSPRRRPCFRRWGECSRCRRGRAPSPGRPTAVRHAEPLDDPVSFRFPASVRHRYERRDRFPAGFLVVGDAVCSFNPIYGQGMSVAALEALTLRRHLARGIEPQPRRWFRDLARVVDVPWDMAAGGDLVFPGVQGRRTLKVRLVSAYLARLHAAAAHDADLATAFIRVAGLVAPPQSLLRPGIALRVLQGRRRHPAAAAVVASSIATRPRPARSCQPDQRSPC